MEKLRVSGFLDNSLVNGLGMRAVIFFSGCTHDCTGCHNKELQDPTCGIEITCEELLERIKKNLGIIRGVTLSGGDPMEQAKKITPLIEKIKDLNLNIWCYTGYVYEEVLKDKEKLEFIKNIDVLVDGKFDITKKKDNLKYIGSSNQRIIDVKKSLQDGELNLLKF